METPRSSTVVGGELAALGRTRLDCAGANANEEPSDLLLDEESLLLLTALMTKHSDS